MNGQLTAVSTLGEGTSFTLTLPRAADISEEDAGAGEGPSLLAPSRDVAAVRTSILHIEDNPANIEVVARFLKTRPGIRLQSVTTGNAGLAVAARDLPDLILLDLHLPGMQGEEVLRRLKDNPATAGIPVAVLSAEAAPSVIRLLRARGAIGYLTKPLDLSELGRMVDSVATGHGDDASPAPRTAPAP
jgi:CheY-like chemotaxis protein